MLKEPRPSLAISKHFLRNLINERENSPKASWEHNSVSENVPQINLFQYDGSSKLREMDLSITLPCVFDGQSNAKLWIKHY